MRNSAAIWIGAGMLLWFGLLRGVKAAKVTFDKLRVVAVRTKSFVYRITLFVHNPLLVDILVNNIEGDVYMQGIKVAEVNYPVNQVIRSFATTAFDIEFEAFNDKLGEALWNNIQTGDAHTLIVRFDGYITIKGVRIPVVKDFTYDEIFGA